MRGIDFQHFPALHVFCCSCICHCLQPKRLSLPSCEAFSKLPGVWGAKFDPQAGYLRHGSAIFLRMCKQELMPRSFCSGSQVSCLSFHEAFLSCAPAELGGHQRTRALCESVADSNLLYLAAQLFLHEVCQALQCGCCLFCLQEETELA